MPPFLCTSFRSRPVPCTCKGLCTRTFCKFYTLLSYSHYLRLTNHTTLRPDRTGFSVPSPPWRSYILHESVGPRKNSGISDSIRNSECRQPPIPPSGQTRYPEPLANQKPTADERFSRKMIISTKRPFATSLNCCRDYYHSGYVISCSAEEILYGVSFCSHSLVLILSLDVGIREHLS